MFFFLYLLYLTQNIVFKLNYIIKFDQFFLYIYHKYLFFYYHKIFLKNVQNF